MTDALEDVVDAALRRALVDGTDARRYFALAGALDRARAGAEADSPPAESVSVDRAGAALVSTVAVRALSASPRDGIDAGAWIPGDSDPHEELVVAGARLARRRFDVDATTVAAAAGVDPVRVVDAEASR
ncbi:hypothetical protein [Halobellus rubicundus]|uniref:Uncharacterized protein n=1 Tax=Halobellus rubicundus TaxID=2996466 RepID=A0ABD5ME42_9EURY